MEPSDAPWRAFVKSCVLTKEQIAELKQMTRPKYVGCFTRGCLGPEPQLALNMSTFYQALIRWHLVHYKHHVHVLFHVHLEVAISRQVACRSGDGHLSTVDPVPCVQCPSKSDRTLPTPNYRTTLLPLLNSFSGTWVPWMTA